MGHYKNCSQGCGINWTLPEAVIQEEALPCSPGGHASNIQAKMQA